MSDLSPEEVLDLHQKLNILMAKSDYNTWLLEQMIPLRTLNDINTIIKVKQKIFESYNLNPSGIKNY